MKASDIMTTGAKTVRPDSTVAHAAQLMVQHGVSGLPVVTDHGGLVGMITEGDLLRRPELGTADLGSPSVEHHPEKDRLAHRYAREHGRKVEDVMSREIVSVSPDAPVDHIVELMEDRGIKRVPVVRGERLIGVISRANLVSALARLSREPPQPVVDDQTIQKNIADEMAGKSWAPGAAIDILVRDGVVTLNGTATSEHIRDAVRVLAENTPGAVRVWDKIRVIDTP